MLFASLACKMEMKKGRLHRALRSRDKRKNIFSFLPEVSGGKNSRREPNIYHFLTSSGLFFPSLTCKKERKLEVMAGNQPLTPHARDGQKQPGIFRLGAEF